jgi:hypothetical protein
MALNDDIDDLTTAADAIAERTNDPVNPYFTKAHFVTFYASLLVVLETMADLLGYGE